MNVFMLHDEKKRFVFKFGFKFSLFIGLKVCSLLLRSQERIKGKKDNLEITTNEKILH